MTAGPFPFDLAPVDLALLDRWQRDFPLVPRPFALLGAALGLAEADVIARVRDLSERDLISRVGAVVRPNTVGASTLAAMAVPPDRLAAVAREVSVEAGVTHNYEREHVLNLWFVVTAADAAGARATLNRIQARTGLEVLDLPLERAYHIDLGFSLTNGGLSKRGRGSSPVDLGHCGLDRDILAALEDGLPILERPYDAVARHLGLSEKDVIERLKRLIDSGLVTRFGLVVKHRNLGYRANAMAVWNLPDDDADRVAAAFIGHSFVTLCYRRPRRLPRWPYNLFCMVHGRDRFTVREQIAKLNTAAGTGGRQQAILFSRKCFKQRGARFAPAPMQDSVHAEAVG